MRVAEEMISNKGSIRASFQWSPIFMPGVSRARSLRILKEFDVCG